jgi:flagellar motor switch protein FliN/FliY
MLEQADIDALLASANELAAETGDASNIRDEDLGLSPPPPPRPPRAPVKIDPNELKRILHMRFPLIVILAERTMPLQEILSLTPGSIIEFECTSDAELGLVIGNSDVGTGQAVKVGEYFGLRINTIGPLEERILAMGS